MQDLIIRDMRLEGARPSGTEVLEVDKNTPLDWPIRWLANKSVEYGGDVRARIMAHGAGFYVASTAGSYGNRNPKYSQGGAGIQFCKQGINLATLPRFAALKGRVPRIDILGCGAAYITPGHAGKDGDGNLLCYRLAQVTKSHVRASTATQRYRKRWAINFGRWEGTVLTYGPSGAVVKIEQAPRN